MKEIVTIKKTFFRSYKFILITLLVIGIPIVTSQSNGFLGNQKDQKSTFNSMNSLSLSSEIELKSYSAAFKIILTTDSPERSFEVNSTVEYQGVLRISVRQDAAANKKAYDIEWNDDSEYTFLFNQSSARTSNNASTDVHWTYYFSNNSLSNTQPLIFTIKLREGYTNVPFTIGFIYNFHYTRKLTVENPNYVIDPRVYNEQYPLNVTQVIIVGITPNSTSDVIFHVEGGYIEDNKDYILTPNQTFVHFIMLRMRNESEMAEDSYSVYPFPFYSFELANIDGSATIHFREIQYVQDPSVPYGSDLSLLVLILTLFGFSLLSIGVCMILSVVIILNDWRTKRKKKD